MWSETFTRLADELRRAWPDAEPLRELERRIRIAEGLTPAEREVLLLRVADDRLAVEGAVGLRDVPTAHLIEQADAGSRAACAELDRRGAEPPSVDLGPPPVQVV